MLDGQELTYFDQVVGIGEWEMIFFGPPSRDLTTKRQDAIAGARAKKRYASSGLNLQQQRGPNCFYLFRRQIEHGGPQMNCVLGSAAKATPSMVRSTAYRTAAIK